MAANGVCSHKNTLHYISAATAALRRRLESLREGHGPSDGSSTVLDPDEAVIAEAALGEVKSLMNQLKPLAQVASEFKVKWDRQKEQLIEQRQAEMAAQLHAESQAISQNAELAMQEEVRAIAFVSEQATHQAAEKMVKSHQLQLEDAIQDWREEVNGSDAVRTADVDKALREALQRVAVWSSEEERHIMQSWTQELSRVVTAAHTLDEEALAAAEDTQLARKSVLDSAIQRHWKALQACRVQLQQRISEKAAALQEEEGAGKSKKAPAHTAVTAALIGKASRNRIATAKTESQEAMEAHRQMAVAQIDIAAQKQILRMAAWEDAMAEVVPELEEQLEHKLVSLRAAHKDALAFEARQARGEDSDSAESAGGSPMKKMSSLAARERSPSVIATPLIGRSAKPSVQGGSRKSVLPGSAPIPRASIFQFGSQGTEEEGSGSADPSTSTDRWNLRSHQGPPTDDDNASDDSEQVRREIAEARQRKAEQCVQLRERLEATQAALMKGEWYAEWRRGLSEAVNLGRAKMRDAEAALEGQATVLRSKEKGNEDMQLFSSAFMDLAQHAKNHATSIRDEMTKIRNVKAGLAMTRADYLRDLMNKYEQDAPSAERDALPFVSKLSRETEIVMEVGWALEAGSERFPVAVVAGAWRRAIAAALQLLRRLWEGAGAPLDEQRAFINKVLAIMARAPEGWKLLDQAVPRS